MSEGPGRLSDMDSMVWLLAALIAGAFVGAAASALVARARGEASAARGASLEAQLDAARAERDAARGRAEEIWADRESMVNQFKLLTHESLAQQTRRAEESAEVRSRATERLLDPVRQSLDAFNRRLADVEKERAALAADLSAQVQSVRLTGEQLRRETASLDRKSVV